MSIDETAAYRSMVPVRSGSILARDVLETLKPNDVFATPVSSVDAGACVICGLWLWHDFLEESHTISQAIDSPTGGLFHAIMHRREGDFSNSKYWYRKCPDHPAFKSLGEKAKSRLDHELADKSLLRLVSSGWNPMAFVDLVEAVHQNADHPMSSIAIDPQRLEWEAAITSVVVG